MMADLPLTCDAVTAALPAYLANVLDDATAEAIESHVSACAACEVRLERATRIDVAAFAPAVPAALRERVLATVPVSPPRVRRSTWWGLAAGLVAVAAAALYVSTTREVASSDHPLTAVATPSDSAAVEAIRSARALAREQAASEFRSLDEAARELEQAIRMAPEDREMRTYVDAVQARRAELAEKIAEAAS